MTTEIDCTEARAASHATGRSFFLHYLYAVVRAANEVDELRYCTDNEGRVVFHDRVDIITPVAVPGHTFYTVRVAYHEDFGRFYNEARRLITHIPADGDPYGAEKTLMTAGQATLREGRLLMPLSIYVNHAFVDGAHLAAFFQRVEQHLKEFGNP